MLGIELAEGVPIVEHRAIDPAIAPLGIGQRGGPLTPDQLRRGMKLQPAHDQMQVGLLVAARTVRRSDRASRRLTRFECVCKALGDGR